jgi:AcrR family transcriptional regulator
MPRAALSDEAVREQRERMLTAALSLFARDGIESVSMRSVADAVGLSPMALYRYFPGGKSELVTTIRGRGFEQLAAQLSSARRAAADDPIAAILRIMEGGIRFGQRHPELYRLMFFVSQDERDPYLLSCRKLAWREATEPFAAAIAAGLLRGDRDTMPHLFFAAMHGAIALELSEQPDPRRRLDRLIVPMLETLLRGSGAAPATVDKVRRAFPSRPSKAKEHP